MAPLAEVVHQQNGTKHDKNDIQRLQRRSKAEAAHQSGGIRQRQPRADAMSQPQAYGAGGWPPPPGHQQQDSEIGSPPARARRWT